VWISPRITQFVPAVALFLVFILTFFPWVGICPGGVCVDSQSAWQAVFGWTSTPDKDTAALSWFKGKQHDKTVPPSMAGEAVEPGFGVLAFFYLPLLMFNLAVAAAVVAAGFFPKLLPPAVLKYFPWRWAILSAVTLVAFFVLLLQDLTGFSLERRATDAVNKVTKTSDEFSKETAILRGTYQQAIVRTFWYRLAFWLHFWALFFAFVTMLANVRTPQPCPRVDLLW